MHSCRLKTIGVRIPRGGGAEKGGFRHEIALRVSPGGGANSFVACLSRLTFDHALRSRRSIVPAPNRDTSNIGRSLRFFRVLHNIFGACLTSFLFGRLLPPSISKDNDRFAATI